MFRVYELVVWPKKKLLRNSYIILIHATNVVEYLLVPAADEDITYSRLQMQ